MASSNSVNIIHGTRAELIVFLSLNIWPSHLGLPILLCILFFSRTVQRHPTFVNLCFTFMLGGISSSLLVYAGKTEGLEPSKSLCLLQASLLYGYPLMASLALFALVFQMFMVIRSSFHGLVDSPSGIRKWTILLLPYIAWIVTIIATVWVGATNPDNISRNRRFFYCSVKSEPLTNSINVTSAAVVLITFLLEVWTVYFFYKYWAALRRKDEKVFLLTEINLSIRVLAFGMYLVIAMSIGFLSLRSPESPVSDLVIASAPTVVILILGTQPDILKAACFWKENKPKPPPKDVYPERYMSPVSDDQQRVWRASETFAPKMSGRI
ncbi:hypothetical protein BDZ89DRAFT_472269 [Hymenopellis radicata]|nr:hypothetical protein BDZ89DRAFT_472269 [Hymenopellis radicata]